MSLLRFPTVELTSWSPSSHRPTSSNLVIVYLVERGTVLFKGVPAVNKNFTTTLLTKLSSRVLWTFPIPPPPPPPPPPLEYNSHWRRYFGLNMMGRLLLLLLCIQSRFWVDVKLVYGDFRYVNQPNTRWSCSTGCENFNEEGIRALFGIVRRAMVIESREVYLTFDHSWIERALSRFARVDITHVKRQELATFTHTRVKSLLSGQPVDSETFYVVVSLSNEYYASMTTQHNNKDKSVVEVKSADSQQHAVDLFLTMNPCFMPLKDPPIDTMWDAVEASTAHSNQNMTLDSLALSYDDPYAAVLIELPNRSFNLTCSFYTLITQLQFPTTCPMVANQNISGTSRDKYYAHYIGDIGWANCMHTMFDHMKNALKQGRVFITPKSISRHDADTLSFPVPDNFFVPPDAEGAWGKPAKIDVDATTGMKTLAMRNYWSTWTDLEGCMNETFAWNPWACNFISLSKCNTPDTYFVKEGGNFEANATEVVDSIYALQFPVIYEKTKHDLDGEWERLHLLAFIMRPNIYLRHRIKIALKRLSHIVKGAKHVQTSHNLTMKTTTSTSTSIIQNNRQHNTIDSPLHQLGGPNLPLQGQCLALHVRNGDSVNDHRGDGTKGMDRTIHGHMRCVRNMTKSLGIKAVFLATDNNTLFSMAKTWFPEYQWYYQRRPVGRYTFYTLMCRSYQ